MFLYHVAKVYFSNLPMTNYNLFIWYLQSLNLTELAFHIFEACENIAVVVCRFTIEQNNLFFLCLALSLLVICPYSHS